MHAAFCGWHISQAVSTGTGTCRGQETADEQALLGRGEISSPGYGNRRQRGNLLRISERFQETGQIPEENKNVISLLPGSTDYRCKTLLLPYVSTGTPVVKRRRQQALRRRNSHYSRSESHINGLLTGPSPVGQGESPRPSQVTPVGHRRPRGLTQ